MAGGILRAVHQTDRRLLNVAWVWAAGVVVLALFAPLYSPSSSTLVDENGLSGLIDMSIPLIAVLVVSVALHYRWRRNLAGAGVLAWTVVVIFGVFNLAGMMSIGVFMLPVTGLLIATCAGSG